MSSHRHRRGHQQPGAAGRPILPWAQAEEGHGTGDDGGWGLGGGDRGVGEGVWEGGGKGVEREGWGEKRRDRGEGKVRDVVLVRFVL